MTQYLEYYSSEHTPADSSPSPWQPVAVEIMLLLTKTIAKIYFSNRLAFLVIELKLRF